MSKHLTICRIIQEKRNLVVILVTLLVASPIALQILLKPVSFLFADDWLLLEYLTPYKSLEMTQLFGLVNGHNVLTTKLSLILFSHFFGANTLSAFALLNLILGSIACILILRKFFLNESYSFNTIIVAAVFFFNFKQAQNYNMVISAHFIHSLLCIAVYLSVVNSRFRKLRYAPLVAAPFTGGFGISLLVLEGYLSARQFLCEKKIRYSLNFLACLFIFTVAYGLNLALGNTISNSPSEGFLSNASSVILHPWLLPNFILSTIGSQFTPSSKHMSTISQIIGLIVLFLLYRIRAQIRGNTDINHALIIVVTSSLLFTFSGYDGTSYSLQNAHSNRYVTCTLLLAILLLAGILNTPGFSFMRLVIPALLLLSLLAGVKSGTEWVSLRSSQSESLERLCYSKSVKDTSECLEIAFSQSFYSDKSSFNERLEQFLKIHRS